MKTKNAFGFLFTSIYVILLAACGPNLAGEVDRAYARVETLNAENLSLSTQVAELQATQAYMAPRMKEMESAISYPTSLRKSCSR